MARRLPKYLLVALALYWAAMFVATHIPGDTLPEQRFGLDKLIHFSAYAALAALAALSLRSIGWLSWKSAALVVVAGAAYGAIDEWLQIYSRRQADAADWAADVAGLVFGITLACVVLAMWPRRVPMASPVRDAD